MHFIEQLLHLSPDGGSGVLETMILLAGVLIPIAVAAFRSHVARIE